VTSHKNLQEVHTQNNENMRKSDPVQSPKGIGMYIKDVVSDGRIRMRLHLE
jgi:hypothetical protein